MKPLVLIACLISALCSKTHAADVHEELVQATAARGILERWQEDEPVESRMRYKTGSNEHRPVKAERFLHIVCWTPSDRALPEDYEGRLTRIMEHIQEFYRSEMERFGFEDHTIRLKYAGEKLVLHVVKGKHPTSHYAVQSGHEIRSECLPTLEAAGIDIKRETVMIMCNLATWDAQQLRFTHKSPYYASGSYRNGTAWQLDSPEIDVNNLKLKEPIISDGQYGRISLGRHNSIFIGGMAHELGHALGLPHCQERPDEAIRGIALMGSGNRTYGDELRNEGRGTFLTLAHALRLASHPQFSGSMKGFDQPAEAIFKIVNFKEDGKSITVSGVVKGSPPIYGVVAYFDPEGHSDYNSTTATAVPNQAGNFTLNCDALAPGKSGELRLFPLHVNGSAADQMSYTPFRYPYKVRADGTPDLSTIRIKQDLVPIIEAVKKGDKFQALFLSSQVRDEKATEIAARLIAQETPETTPDNYDGEKTEVELTSLKPQSVNVGWGSPAYNRLPNESMLLESGGNIFQSGIYAHAPATHIYQVGKKWKVLKGTVGVASGHRGTVQFEIKGDGKSLWKSPVISTKTEAFDVDLSGVKNLELLTHPTADGNRADWGLWLEPVLSR